MDERTAGSARPQAIFSVYFIGSRSVDIQSMNQSASSDIDEIGRSVDLQFHGSIVPESYA